MTTRNIQQEKSKLEKEFINSSIFKNFVNKFPSFYKIKNPNFILMTRYYIRKPTFKYLWFLFFKDPLRIITNFIIHIVPLLIKETSQAIFFKLFSKTFFSKTEERKSTLYKDLEDAKIIDYFSKGQGFITISYCQKPFYCPDGRFSLKCSAEYEICNSCFLSKINRKCKELSLDYYIVLGDYDSVWNILKNQFFKHKRGAYILTVCNMVLNVIKYLSPLFGFKGYIVPFIKGECKTLAAYELSEFGYKNIQTDISEHNKLLILSLLDKAIEKKKEFERKRKIKEFKRKWLLLTGGKI